MSFDERREMSFDKHRESFRPTKPTELPNVPAPRPPAQPEMSGCFSCEHQHFCLSWQKIRDAILTSPVVNFGRSECFRQLGDLIGGECNVGPKIADTDHDGDQI